MPDLSRREVIPELMDQPGLDAAEHARALRGLERINRISATDDPLWKRIRHVAEIAGAPIHVLDVACGGGDVMLRLARRATRAGVDLRFSGCDISPTAVAHAREATARLGLPATFFQHDILESALPETCDVLVCNLFLHHLDEKAALVVLGRLREAAARLVLVQDLVRSPIGFALAYAGTRVLSRSRVVHHDGPISVRAAFTIAEVRQLAERSGMSDARISWQWPFRFFLEWHRT